MTDTAAAEEKAKILTTIVWTLTLTGLFILYWAASPTTALGVALIAGARALRTMQTNGHIIMLIDAIRDPKQCTKPF